MKIYIIRHGETALNTVGIMQGWLDEPLNDSGRFLAAETGKALKEIHFDRCYCSPLVRTKETAEIVLRESGNTVPIEFDSRIKEISFGSREGTKMDKEEKIRFFVTPFQFGRFPEGESIQDVCARTQSFLDELIHRTEEETVLVSTHGCALRAMLNRLYPDPEEFWQGHPPYNCAVSILEAEEGKVKLLASDQVYYDSKYIVDRYKIEP